MSNRNDDPDETDGRALYRAHANTLARAQVSMARRQIWIKQPKPDGRDTEAPLTKEPQ